MTALAPMEPAVAVVVFFRDIALSLDALLLSCISTEILPASSLLILHIWLWNELLVSPAVSYEEVTFESNLHEAKVT